LRGETKKRCAECHPHVGHKNMIEAANRYFKKQTEKL
jgi:cytochrome c-type protein NapC